MLCKREGFTAIKIATLVVLSAKTATKVAALVCNWDRIDTIFFGIKIRGHGNLFRVTVEEDGVTFFAKQEVRDKQDFIDYECDIPVPNRKSHDIILPLKDGWRESVKLLETTAIGIGGLGAVFVVLPALLIKFTRGFWLHFLMRILGILSILCSSNEILVGAMLYKYQFHNVLSDNAKNPRTKMPVDDYVVTTGWFMACGAAGTYLLAAILEISEIALGFSKSFKESTNVVEPLKDINKDVQETNENPNTKGKDVILHPNIVATIDINDSKKKKDVKDKNQVKN